MMPHATTLLERSTLIDVVRAHASQAPDRPFLLTPGAARLSYGRLLQEIRSVGEALASRGIGRTDRVLMAIADRPQAALAYLCVAAAAVAVPTNPEPSEAEIDEVLAQIRPKAVIARTSGGGVERAAARAGIPVIALDPLLDGEAGCFTLSGGHCGAAVASGLPQPDDIASILMSSGTTSRPKAIPLSHRLMVLRGQADSDHLHLHRDDVCMNFRPPYLTGALSSGLIPALVSGGAVVVPDRFDADGFFAALGAFGVSWYTGGPAHHQALLERAVHHRDDLAAGRLRLVRSAGYALDPALFDRIEAMLGVVCIEKYGSTESGPVCCNPLPPGRRRKGTVGLPMSGDLEVVDASGNAVPAGTEGEIRVRRRTVFDGYFDDPARTAAVLRDGWYWTGDIGRIDADGYVTILGRLGDLINRGGQKVSPQDVENALRLHPGVTDCICFGVPHPSLGQLVMAAVVAGPDSPLDETDLRTFMRTKVSLFKVPSRIVVWPDIPKGPTGKPMRPRASQRFLADQEASGPDFDEGNALTRAIADLWGRVLRIDGIGEADDFFRLGGDSLRAAALLAEIEEVHGVALPFETLFTQSATVAGMAEAISAARAAQQIEALADTPPSLLERLFRRLARRAPPRQPSAPDPRPPDFPEMLRRLELSANGWQGHAVGRDVSLFLLNPDGRLPPLFWCFNGANEPAIMAAMMPDRPIYAMRSLNGLIDDHERRQSFAEALADLYTREILRLVHSDPVLVGGNCQSGFIAETIARNLLRRNRQVAQLSVLDYQPKSPYPGGLALFFGADSVTHNPFLTDTQSEDRLTRWHPQLTWDFVPGAHGTYFFPDHAPAFVGRLNDRLIAATNGDFVSPIPREAARRFNSA